MGKLGSSVGGNLNIPFILRVCQYPYSKKMIPFNKVSLKIDFVIHVHSVKNVNVCSKLVIIIKYIFF